MASRKPINRVRDFEQALEDSQNSLQKYRLRLYVTGSTERSTQAIQAIRQVCDQHLRGRYELEVVDIHQQPVLAQGEQIVAAPTLIKVLPPPLRKLIGNLSDEERVLVGLDVQEARGSA
jgi:circadian clock protein KaiB